MSYDHKPATEEAHMTEAERETLDAILVALWQCETERGYEHMRAKVERLFIQRRTEAYHAGVQAALDAAARAVRAARTAPGGEG